MASLARSSSVRPVCGITLIELLVGVSILAIIAGAAGACLLGGLRTREVIDARADVLQVGRVVEELLERDFRNAIPLHPEREFVGLDRELDSVAADTVDFATRHFEPQTPGERDACEVSYFVDREPGGSGLALYRRTDPTPDEFPLEGGFRELICHGVRGFQVEYYDGFEWYETWGPQRERVVERTERSLFAGNLTGLPDAVRITLSLEEGSGERAPGFWSDAEALEPLVFRTVVHLVNAEWARWGSSYTLPETGEDGEESSGDTGGESPGEDR